MNLVFFSHPEFLSHQSMPRFVRMLVEGMAARGHKTEIWSADSVFSKLHSNSVIKKWLGYVDQYLLFPRKFQRKAKRYSRDTLFVFTDQALGPWVPPIADRPHVIHCHDFMALSSALGEIDENPTGWTGKQYQKLIRRGFSRGEHFISVSQKTRDDLHRYLARSPRSSDVVYNGFHQPFFPQPEKESRISFGKKMNLELSSGYILHVGGNLWYKNRRGVMEIYIAWRSFSSIKLPLILIGEPPSEELEEIWKSSPYRHDIHWLINVDDSVVRIAYSGATVFLFPSLGEGFGWPIAESMASGCPVITTNVSPMSEVAADAGFMIPRRPMEENLVPAWASNAAKILEKVVVLSPEDRKNVITLGVANARRFDTKIALDKIEKIYSDILEGKK